MPTYSCRAGAAEAPHPLSVREIGARLDGLRDAVSAMAAGDRGRPRLLEPRALLRCLASLTSRN